LKTLEDLGGNRTRTAEVLGISRRTLQLKLKGYGIN
jgi:two-component system response regulator HydG